MLDSGSHFHPSRNTKAGTHLEFDETSRNQLKTQMGFNIQENSSMRAPPSLKDLGDVLKDRSSSYVPSEYAALNTKAELKNEKIL